MENKLVGNYFKTIRLKRGYSEEYMSFKLNVSQSTISNVENGKIKIDVARIIDFCNVLDIELVELVHAMMSAVAEINNEPAPPKPEIRKETTSDPVIYKLELIANHLERQNELIERFLDLKERGMTGTGY
jgi:transcriptional regulator with XRE-family HTH domain